MPLYKIEDYYPNYRDTFGGDDIKALSLYTQGGEKVGSVEDALVDQDGRFRYLVVDTGAWIFGKKILLPIGLARIDYTAKRAYVDGLSKKQVENLPEYRKDMTVDRAYEDQVRRGYQPTYTATGDRPAHDYDLEPGFYGLNEQRHQTLKLYEERLIANKIREKTGEVAIGKHVETETARASVPVEKERVVIERHAPGEIGTRVTPDETPFQEGEVARIEIYEERPDIHKETVIREEVRVSKEVDREVIDTEETLRSEELDIDTQGRTIEERR